MPETPMLRILLGLKLRLFGRSFTRGKGTAMRLAAMVGLALAFLPFWLGLMFAAYFGARRYGAPAVATALGTVHLGWVAATLLLASFAEGIDLRALLRYPVRPRAVFWLNVLVAPLDLVALFLLPPLGALALGTFKRSGPLAGVLVGAAGLALLLITSAVSQTLLAALGRYLRREWTRALFGLLVGLVFLAPTLLLRAMERHSNQLPPGIVERLPDLAAVFAWFPPTALPVRAAAAAEGGRWLAAGAHLAGAVLLLVALVDLGARIALREAMNRDAPAERRAEPRAEPRVTTAPAADRRRTRGVGLLARLLPADLATLVERELRTFVRTPQILLGLFMVPLMMVLLGSGRHFPAGSHPFLFTFVCLTAALNLSGNQFGLDHAGVRLLFLLPIAPRRLLVAKHLAVVVLVAVMAALCLVVVRVMGIGMDALGAATALVSLAAALPVMLSFGCFLSIYHPWRMVFRLGGAPPGAMLSGFLQLAVLGGVALLLVPALVVVPALLQARGAVGWMRLGALAATAVTAVVLWGLWALVLGRAARALVARREILIDRLARPGETG